MQPLYQQPQQAALNLTFFSYLHFVLEALGCHYYSSRCVLIYSLTSWFAPLFPYWLFRPVEILCTVQSYCFSAQPHCLCGFWFVCPNSDFQGNHCHTLVTDFHSNSVCIALAKSIRCIKHQLLIINVRILSDTDACFMAQDWRFVPLCFCAWSPMNKTLHSHSFG